METLKKSDPRLDLAEKVINAAKNIYCKHAQENTPPAYQEFIKKSKLKAETLHHFEIGFAPNNQALSIYLSKLPEDIREKALKMAEDLGLVRKNPQQDSYFDFFRDRIMFPIWNHEGKVRGFSSRAVKEGQNPKYLNSKESFAFDKGNILFGWNFAKKSIRQQNMAIVVEGHMDVITMHQFGFDYAVGTQGISLSLNALKKLSKLTTQIILGMDSDPAGFKAMEKIHQECLFLGFFPR